MCVLCCVDLTNGLSKAGLRYPGISAKLEFRYESLKSRFSFILFAYNLMIGCSKRIEQIIWENAFEQKKKKPRYKFNPGLALIGPRTAGTSCTALLILKREGFIW